MTPGAEETATRRLPCTEILEKSSALPVLVVILIRNGEEHIHKCLIQEQLLGLGRKIWSG